MKTESESEVCGDRCAETSTEAESNPDREPSNFNIVVQGVWVGFEPPREWQYLPQLSSFFLAIMCANKPFFTQHEEETESVG